MFGAQGRTQAEHLGQDDNDKDKLIEKLQLQLQQLQLQQAVSPSQNTPSNKRDGGGGRNARRQSRQLDDTPSRGPREAWGRGDNEIQPLPLTWTPLTPPHSSPAIAGHAASPGSARTPRAHSVEKDAHDLVTAYYRKTIHAVMALEIGVVRQQQKGKGKEINEEERIEKEEKEVEQLASDLTWAARVDNRRLVAICRRMKLGGRGR